ncbi:ABC transporter ATP-binding protein/permease [Flavobacteriaceae bacterium]|jgi:ATP-binding cassette, subfamily B, multidrug efflux pump|nr:ABC transporter ATP-binding protein/permease [Flavobacteriaceae bacterium]MDB0069091.1 ABC transporter ATP-binding protein/permease [Flavobacteriaceae bacterium]MDB9793723.1 ABC transporter ATP-binding protein/permease [Flavobacteriaceae bacterium]MDC1279526.1 ABC transporter ATP-binding protein/permease [Flavobacteriaceae bacterium]MDC1336092.1 ABC transporter ATP-binding protein/permease [Flavobacteriaceae bacterium]|tara:strand:+ start:17818 stop:19602 length:1785 start_codon:yes stop_codon:yes gene_type:complete
MTKNSNLLDVKLFKRLLEYVLIYRTVFVFVGISAILISIFSTLTPYLIKVAVDDYLALGKYQDFIFLIIIMFFNLMLTVLFMFLFSYYANLLGQKVIYDIRVQLFKHILDFKMSYFDKSSVGRLVTRAVNDMETIASIFSQGLFMIAADLMQMFLVIIVMLFLSWKLSLTIFIILPFILFATRKFQKSMKIAFNEVRSEVANLNSFVQERITGMKIVQLFNREKIEYDNFVKINEKHKKAWLKTVWYNSIFFPIAELSTSVTIGLIVWFGGLNAILENSSITLGTIFLFIQLSQMLFRPLRQIADKFNTLQMGMVAANRIFKIIDTRSNISDSGTKNEELIDGNIVFENISFSYVENEKVIKNLSFNIKNGEKIAIVGSTGSGKTTIVNLISRFYDAQEGSIFIANQNIKDYKLKSLRSRTALVLQDVFLFADTILNNITLWDSSISFDSVVSAAKKIGIHNFIISLPNGYNYNVKERGVMLSQGQRQLISFLRAYIKNPSILILDEATSSIDSNSEELIQNATATITQNKTSIIIAHRLSTILNSDRIFVMNQGVLVENGSHKELISKKGGYYKDLYEIQFKKEEATVVQSQV